MRIDLTVGLAVVLAATLVIISSIIFYSSLLPKTITTSNSNWIQQSAYIFYLILAFGIFAEAFGLHRIFRFLKKYANRNYLDFENENDSTTIANNNTLNEQITVTGHIYGAFRIILDICSNKRYFRFFLPITVTYLIIYSIISGIIIIRPEGGLAHSLGIHSFPLVIMMQYGPVGYVPTMSVYLSDNFGIFIIPLNLVIALAVSALVGFNSVLSIYAFFNQYDKKRLFSFTNASSKSQSSSSFMGALGATTGLFIACPTCASFYIFSAMVGGFAPSIAAFTVTHYTLFVMISIPLLLFTPLITALSIKKTKMNERFGQCSLYKKKLTG